MVLRALAGGVLALGAVSCASPGIPPGGPPDVAPPVLVRVSPDTNAVNVRPREVVFTFDEVVAESPRGGGGSAPGGDGGSAASRLAGIVTVSPRSGAVRVDWGRERLGIRPRGGFQPNRTYTVTLGPGLADIRGNVLDSVLAVTFSTGGPIARGTLYGAVFDWVGGKAAAGAVIEALAPDSTVYLAVAGEDGRFTLRNVPPGRYLVRGTLDVNGNRFPDPREPFDTTRAVAVVLPNGFVRADTVRADTTRGRPPVRDTLAVALYAFPRDTVGPTLTQIQQPDSVTLRLTFDRPLLPGQPFDTASVRVLAADSTPVRVLAVLTPAVADSLARREQARADSVAPASDSVGRRPPGAPRAGVDSARAATPGGAVPQSAIPAPPAPGRPRGAGSGRAQEQPPGTRPRRPAPEPPPLDRPTPSPDLVVTLAAPLRAQAQYRVQARAVRALTGVARTSDRLLTTPRASQPTPPAGAAPPNAPNRSPGARPASTPPASAPPASAPPAGAPPAGAPPAGARPAR